MKRGEMRMYGLVGIDLGDGGCITAQGVGDELDRYRVDGVDALDVYLSSDGGSVVEGLAIHDQIKRFSGDVTIHVDGRALSIASVIALSGKRLVMPRSAMMMIHDPWVPTAGNRKAHKKSLAMLDAMFATMQGIYCAKSGLSSERVQKMMDDAETWLTADDAKALGLCDEVTGGSPRKPAARSLLLDCYQNTPADLRGMRAEAALAKLEGLLARQRVKEIARSASAAAARVTGIEPKGK